VPPSQPLRADLPGALDHASGEVDEFDAALVRGAGGVTATPEAGLEDDRSEPVPPAAGATQSEATASRVEPEAPPSAAVVSDSADVDAQVVREAPPGRGTGDGAGGDAGGGEGGDGGAGSGDREQPSGTPERGASRAVAFLRASWAELQRMQWPDRRHVTQATAVVLGFVALAGAYLGAADYVANEIVEFFLG
jgi:preprotein translocase subunit SecE